MKSLVFTPRAERDLEAIGDYIAKDSPRRALSFVRELRAQCVKITNAPQGYRTRSELGEGIRFSAYGNYLIYFVIADEAIVRIVRILHGAMDTTVRFNDGKPIGS